MQKYFKKVPLGFLMIYAMMCYGYYGMHVLYHMLWLTTEKMVGHGIATSLVFGFSAAFLVAAFRIFFKEGQYLLGSSLFHKQQLFHFVHCFGFSSCSARCGNLS